MPKLLCLALLGLIVGLSVSLPPHAAALEVGFGVVDITPDVGGDKPVYIAGYGQNRRATGVHDPLYVRAVVFRDGDQKIAMLTADVVGLFYGTTKTIREKLDGFSYVLVSSTHNHEGPDTMGIWGPSPFRTGIDPDYMRRLIDACVQAVNEADAAAVAAEALYGTAEDEKLLRDSRLPIVYDPVLRALRFTPPGDASKTVGLVLQWNCHPEAMGGSNTEITADFNWATIARLEKKYQCPIVLFTGTVGGLMAPPRNVIQNEAGEYPGEGDFEYCRLYGEAVADLAIAAIESATPLQLTPFIVSARAISVPMTNPIYQMGRLVGIIDREGYVWTGDFREIGEPVTSKTANQTAAAETEVCYVRLGDLHVAGIPGELYPELVYGQYQDPLEPNVDFPDAPLEKPLVEILPGDKFLMIGLANDELGYIIPKRQWDDKPPFAYGRKERQYGEVNSIGPETAPILMQALEERVRDVTPVE